MLRLAFLFSLALPLAPATQALAMQPPPRDPALIAYLMSSADTLSESSDPRELWVAARLLKQVENWTLPLDGNELMNSNEASTRIGHRRDALMQRALELGAKDPLLAWIASSYSCPASPSVCKHADALARLRTLAPSNAASWWTVVGHGPEHVDTPDELKQRLERIAAASRFDTYESDLILTLVRGLERTAVPLALLEPASQGALPASVRAQIAFEIQIGDLSPASDRQIFVFCTAQDIDDRRRSLCEEVGRVAMEKSGNQLVYRLGARLLQRLLPEGDARNTVVRRVRVMAWQQDQLMELVKLIPEQTAGAEWAQRNVDCLIQTGATELGCTRHLLQESGRALDPPASWRSRWESLPVEPVPAQ